ncbi:glycosyltransferase family 2 protein [candidate division KSB1 bacterium]
MIRPKASIIILDFFKSKRVAQNVASIHAQKTDFPYEIIIVDNSANPLNAKKLDPLRKFPNVKVFINETNVGYVRGNNRGVKRAKGEYIFIVNPDIIWKETDTMQKLVDYMDNHPDVGIVGPKQINDDDSITMSVRAFPKLSLQIARRTKLRNMPVIKKFVANDECQNMDYSKTQPVDWLQSSFWVTRQSLWNKIGGLDPRYFIFMSDPDFCWRVWRAGYKVIYYPLVTVRADGQRCSAGGVKDFFTKWILRQHFKDACKYKIAHFREKNPRKEHLS